MERLRSYVLAPMGAQASVRIVLAAGLVLIAIAIAATLSRSPPAVVGKSSVATVVPVAKTRGNAVFCQGGETLPGGTSAIRLWLHTNVNPPVQVAVFSGSHVVTRGRQRPGRLTEALAIPVTPVARAITGARVCFKFGPAVEPVILLGGVIPHPRPGQAQAELEVEYLRAGTRSWWSLAPSVARRVGLGRAPSGTWVALVPILLMAVAGVLALGLIQRQLGEAARAPTARIPAPAWICAGVACLSAASWSILTPPFQAPDEPSHLAYVQQLAEAQSLPTSGGSAFSQEEEVALEDLHHLEVRFNPAVGTISTAAQQRRLEAALARPLARRGAGDAGVAATQPPLYYALETIPYLLGSSASLLVRLELMRLLSAVMAAMAALFAFLFLREALPQTPWAWTVGALAMALAPLVGFIGGVVNPDSMLCAVCAALFLCLARAFRRGLTLGRAGAIGTVTAIGLLTKLNFLGVLPGVALALVVLARRAGRARRGVAYATLALAIPTGPACLYVAINLLSNHPGLGLLSNGLAVTSRHGSIGRELAYIWQLYLPRLPGMTNDFPGVLAPRALWFDRSVGAYGWLDTYFPNWVYDLALVPAAAIAALCLRNALANRAALRARAGEVSAYALIGAGVMALIAADSYLSFPISAGHYAEPRYLLPVGVLFAAVLALAARGAGRRWGPAAGALIVVSILAHDLFSLLLVVGRFYG